MSAFLGPIHFWVYKKIQIQQDLVDDILALGEIHLPDLREELDNRFGASEKKPLGDVIDLTNIHGWLQENVTRVENKLAFGVTRLTNIYPDMKAQIREIFRLKGMQLSTQLEGKSASEAYKLISDSLLDGMPCDHANSLVTDDHDLSVFRRNNCVHSQYWEEAKGDVSLYYDFRSAFIEGCLNGTELVFEKLDDVTSSIKRRA